MIKGDSLKRSCPHNGSLEMTADLLSQMTDAIDCIRVANPVGRVDAVVGGTVRISGLTQEAGLGDRVEFKRNSIAGEVVRLEHDKVYVLVDGPTEGIAIKDIVSLLPPPSFSPSETWIGRVIDPDGRPMDGKILLASNSTRSVQASPPAPHKRRGFGDRIETGIAVFNTILPIVRGQRIGLFAGSGVGKSTLIADLSRGIAADVIVIALVGERGREVRHFVEEVLGPEGMARAVVVAATSDRAPQTRRRCAWAAMAVAEYFRDQGLQVMLFVDSVTRFCEAHREIAVAGGEAAALRGYPASTGPAIAALCERAGPGEGEMGDITAVFSVLVAGSDMEEPVADMLRGVLDGHVVLDRAIAERGRFPAVDVLRSVSRSLPDAANRIENAAIAQTRSLLGTYDKAELMIQAGLYTTGSDKQTDAAIACHPAIERFLSTKDNRGVGAHFNSLRQALASTNGQRDDQI
jgi:flagellum-specific ATP synthase